MLDAARGFGVTAGGSLVLDLLTPPPSPRRCGRWPGRRHRDLSRRRQPWMRAGAPPPRSVRSRCQAMRRFPLPGAAGRTHLYARSRTTRDLARWSPIGGERGCHVRAWHRLSYGCLRGGLRPTTGKAADTTVKNVTPPMAGGQRARVSEQRSPAASFEFGDWYQILATPAGEGEKTHSKQRILQHVQPLADHPADDTTAEQGRHQPPARGPIRDGELGDGGAPAVWQLVAVLRVRFCRGSVPQERKRSPVRRRAAPRAETPCS